MTQELVSLFDEYMQRVHTTETAPNPPRDDLASEVAERLNQLAFITTQLDQINSQFRTIVMLETVNEKGEKELHNAAHERDRHLEFVMRLLTESYYYFAFRVRQILRNKVHPFSSLGSFEAIGVRDVRNHLIEHPEGKDSRVFNRTFMWSLDSGMHLKSGRHEWESSGFVDHGLKANASEFTQNLRDALVRAIESTVSPQKKGGLTPSNQTPASPR